MWTLLWRHNGRGSVLNHKPRDCFLNRISDAAQRKHQSFASPAFVRGIHRSPVKSPHKGQWRGKCFHLMTSSWICKMLIFARCQGSETWSISIWRYKKFILVRYYSKQSYLCCLLYVRSWKRYEIILNLIKAILHAQIYTYLSSDWSFTEYQNCMGALWKCRMVPI